MTLIVANSLNENVRIISDSKKTSPDEILRGTNNHVLKSVIICPALCVCFAGSVGRAQIAIQKLALSRANPFDLEKVLEFLLLEHRAGNNDPDFIVAATSPFTTLNKISGGELSRNLPSCWIGNYDAFSDYQTQFHSTSIPNQGDDLGTKAEFFTLVSKMEMAFRSVIQSNVHPDVGEFSISVMTDTDGFRYAPAANMQGSLGTQSIPSLSWTTVSFGSTGEGGYSYSIMTPLEAGVGALGIHFYQGYLGALFYPMKFANPITYKNVSADEFKRKVKAQFGFEIQGVQIS
jgi:hypothetical protein